MSDHELLNLPESFYRQLLNAMDEGVYFVDRSRRIVFWNSGAEQLSGFTAEDVEGRFCGDGILMHIDFDGVLLCGEGCPLKACMEDRKTSQMDVFLRHRDGHRVPVRVIASPVLNQDNEVIGAVERFQDITPQLADRSKLDELEEEVHTDSLTGIANRRYAELALQERFFRYNSSHEKFGVMFVDMDGLKGINDRYGHSVGDQAIILIAKTLSGIFRSDDLTARWGGDEFLVVLGKVDMDVLQKVREKVKKVIGEAKLPGNYGDAKLGISIGLAEVQDGDTPEVMVRRADRDMYDDKQLNKIKE